MRWNRYLVRVFVYNVLLDVIVLGCIFYFSFLLRFEGQIPWQYIPAFLYGLPLAIVPKLFAAWFFRVYHASPRHVGLPFAVSVAASVAAGSAAFAGLLYVVRDVQYLSAIPRSILAIDFALSLPGLEVTRFAERILFQARRRFGKGDHPAKVRAIIAGAGDAGAQLVKATQDDVTSPYEIVCFVDDDPRNQGLKIRGVPVRGTLDQLPQIREQLDADALLVAMPSAPPAAIRETADVARKAGFPVVQIVPSLSELYSGQVSNAALREIRPEDVLGRERVKVDEEPIRAFLGGQTALVTGAAGSIGSEICRQVLRFGARRVVAVDFNETGLFHLQDEISQLFANQRLTIEVADVRDRTRVAAIFADVSPSIVYHAAAYKHVPIMEDFPCEAVKANVFGTRNMVEEACRAGSRVFVLISTDKAVNPTSVMGATKRVAEMLVRQCGAGSKTRCVTVRFGNVLGSRGSVLDTFIKQIERRQPITVTHPNMKRFFMVASEAVQLVVQASVIGQDGDLMVLDMGELVGIVELAKDLIRFYGLEPDRDVPIIFTGTRPGEKLLEELLTAEENTDRTSHERVLVAKIGTPAPGWEKDLVVLERASRECNPQAVLSTLRSLVPSYRTPEEGNHLLSKD
jgi:FlaA1/EpsC-like NDP-sugar epimerase